MLRRRGIEERIPVTDAEMAEVSATERGPPAMDPAECQWRNHTFIAGQYRADTLLFTVVTLGPL